MDLTKKYLGEASIKKKDDVVKVPHKGKMVSGKVVRYDKGDPGGVPYYVVYVGEPSSIKVPAHKIKESVNEMKMKMDQLNSKGTILLQYDDDKNPKHFTIRAGHSEVLLMRKEAEALFRSLKRLL